jgi:hypothetical protein
MTTQTKNSLHLSVGKGRGWKDAFVVTFLVIVLGAFVAQISSSPKHAPGSEPVTTTASAAVFHG